MTKFKENLIVVVATIFFTWAIIFFVNHTNLTTDVLWNKNKQQSLLQDMEFVFDNWTAKLVSTKDIDNVSSVTMELLFDSSKVKLSKDSFNSPFGMSLSNKEWGNGYNLMLLNVHSLSKWQSILEITNITQEQFDNMNIGHIRVFDNTWNKMDLTSSRK